MAVTLDDSSVTYEQLADLESEFDDVETEIIRQQTELSRPLYEKRQKLTAQIPNFWPLVVEQAPADIDEFIQPSDSALLLSSLSALSVSRFEIEHGRRGDPRSVAIRWEFSENEYFEDRVLEKKFWYRRATDGWAGLVSEPVDIRWKKGKDLTGGLLALAKKIWDEEQVAAAARGQDKAAISAGGRQHGRTQPLTADQKALKKKIENTGLGGVSFFAWFGYRGRDVSAEESALAAEKDREKRRRRLEGADANSNGHDDDTLEDDDEEEEDDEDDDGLEIFPNGDELAIAIAEDLWPGAIKYFTQAQGQDTMSDDEFESEDDEDSPSGDRGLEDRPAKKRKP